MPFIFMNFILFILCIYTYLQFRSGIYSYYRLCKMSKTHIRKAMKGARNFWLYSQLHKEKGLGILYYLNIIYVSFLVMFSFLIPLSVISFMRLPIIIVGILSGITAIPVYFNALIWSNRESCGSAFVLFDIVKGYNGRSRYFISAFDWIACILPLGVYILLLIR